MGFIANCTDGNLVWLRGLKSSSTVRYINLLYSGGVIGYTSLPAKVVTTTYEGEYEWMGLKKETAEAQVALLNSSTGKIGGDGKTGLKIDILEPTIGGDPATISYDKKGILMGTASAQPSGGCFWSCHVGINYSTTTIELLQK